MTKRFVFNLDPALIAEIDAYGAALSAEVGIRVTRPQALIKLVRMGLSMAAVDALHARKTKAGAK